MFWKHKKAVAPTVGVVEVPRAERLTPDTESDREAIAALDTHPGFRRLVAKLRFQQQLLELKATRERPKNLREVDFVQSGIFWTGWLDAQVAREVKRPRRTAEPLNSTEQSALEAVRAAIEVVG